MKKCITLILLYAGIVIPLVAINETDFTVYRDSSYAFSFHYPRSWAPVEATHKQTRFKAVSDNGNGTEDVSINVIPNPDRKDSPPSAHIAWISGNAESVVEMMKKNYPDATLVNHGKTKLSNQDAYYIVVDYSYEAAGYVFNIRQIQYYTGRDGLNYTITMRSLRSDWESKAGLFPLLAARFILHPKLP